jgi:hypothetical protein
MVFDAPNAGPGLWTGQTESCSLAREKREGSAAAATGKFFWPRGETPLSEVIIIPFLANKPLMISSQP